MDSFAQRLLEWSAEHGRHDLPWQRDPTPYSIWISEIMLQQTQVATAIPFYQRFMKRFPRLTDLARAPSDEVLAQWAGLGYYARARNLHRAARIVLERHDGQLPESLPDLLALPGIGRSTGSAILALAKGQRLPILDGNVKRVLARYHGVVGWPGEAAVAKRLWSLAERHTPTEAVAQYTQAIMDLGATICTRRPQCSLCPVASDCEARRAARQSQLPSPRPKRRRPQRRVRVLIVRDTERRILLERRPPSGIWGGLFSFPELPEDQDPGEWCVGNLGRSFASSEKLPPLRHAFTHFDLRMEPLALQLGADSGTVMDRDNWLWYNPAGEARVGLPAPVATLMDDVKRGCDRPKVSV